MPPSRGRQSIVAMFATDSNAQSLAAKEALSAVPKSYANTASILWNELNTSIFEHRSNPPKSNLSELFPAL
jgi:hypothetical protein